MGSIPAGTTSLPQSMQILFDAHSHLPNTDAEPPNHQRVVCGTCEADWEAVLAHAASDERVIPMLGLHPWCVADASSDWAFRLEALLRTHPVGVGECGLDFARKETDRPAQEYVFRLHLRLAQALRRPIALHVVRAWGRAIDLLREEGLSSAGAMVHAFGGSPETARALQSMGVFLSFSGALLKADRPKVREALRSVEAGHLLLETDGVSNLEAVVGMAAGILQVPVGDLAAQTWENGQRCFKRWQG